MRPLLAACQKLPAKQGAFTVGELEGAAARLEWDRMPRKALHSKALRPAQRGLLHRAAVQK